MVLILAIRSDEFLRKVCAADNVEMNVHYCLACAFAAVVDRSVSIAYTLDLGDFSDRFCDLCRIKRALRIGGKFIDVREMLFRNNENMYRSYGINVVEAENIFVLIYF